LTLDLSQLFATHSIATDFVISAIQTQSRIIANNAADPITRAMLTAKPDALLGGVALGWMPCVLVLRPLLVARLQIKGGSSSPVKPRICTFVDTRSKTVVLPAEYASL
jgi:sulfite exporter TauE/SafE